MKKRLRYLICSILLFLPLAVLADVPNHVVISEIYGGGGNTGSVYSFDFVELYNPTNADVDMSGWSVQYASAVISGAFSTANTTVFPANSIIKAHGYFLIQEGGGANTPAALPTADVTGTLAMGAAAGRIALVNNSTALATTAANGAGVVDFVGFGSTAVTFEGTGPTVAPSNSTSIERKFSSTSTAATMAAGGSEDKMGNSYDSDNNANDFFVPTTVNPQNSASPVEPAVASTTLTVTPTSLDFGTTQQVGVASAAKSFVLSGTGLTAGASLTVSGPFTISATSAGTYGTALTFTQTDLAASPTVYVKFTPATATAASGNVSITSGSGSTAVSLTGTGAASANPATLTVTPTTLTFTSQTVGITSPAQFFNFTATNLSDVVTATSSGPYLVSKDGTAFSNVVSYTMAEAALGPKVYVNFTPTAVGTAITGTVTVATTTATSKVVNLTGTGAAVPAPPAGTATHLVISEVYGAGGNTGAVYNSDFIELYNPTGSAVDISGWSVQYNSATSTTAFTGITVFPTGSIVKAHGFYLVQEQSGGTAGAALPTPDMATTGTVNNFNLSGTAGKAALVNNGTLIAAKPTLPNASIVDLVSFGTTAAYWEGSGPAVAPSTTTSIERKALSTSTSATMAAGGADELKGNGFDDDDNANDFVVPATINPQNSSSVFEPAFTPTYTATPTPLTFSQNVNTTSAGVAVTLSGLGILPATSVGTSGPYLISKTATGGYTNTLTFTATEMAATTKPVVYVQFTPVALGAANNNLYITGAGAAQQIIPLNGTGTAQPVPTLTASQAKLTFVSAVGVASDVQFYTLSGTNITQPTLVSVTGPYTISTDGTTFSTSVTFAATDLNAGQTPKVYVKFTPTVVGSNSGAVVQTTTGGGTATATVALDGSGANSVPTLPVIADQLICYTTAPQIIALSGVTPGAETSQSVILSVTTNNPSLFSSIGVLPVTSGASSINYTIASGKSGIAVITLKIKDNGGIANGGVDTLFRTFNLTVSPVASISISIDRPNNIVEKGSTATLTASGGVAGSVYNWTSTVPANVTSLLTGQSITIRPSLFATYTVTVTNPCGTATSKASLGVEISNAAKLETSNVLTPNGDGKNDYWVIRNIDLYPGNTVKVFSKAGKLLYSKTGYNNDWNGYYNGSPLSQGSYYYVVDLGAGLTYRGVISVVRD